MVKTHLVTHLQSHSQWCSYWIQFYKFTLDLILVNLVPIFILIHINITDDLKLGFNFFKNQFSKWLSLYYYYTYSITIINSSTCTNINPHRHLRKLQLLRTYWVLNTHTNRRNRSSNHFGLGTQFRLSI